ncbi:MAG: hypothetical protein WDN75_19430 [Bacteroidota bacterium]
MTTSYAPTSRSSRESRAEECFSFKVTRDAEISLDEVYQGDLAEKIERQILKRDLALATRFLYEPSNA